MRERKAYTLIELLIVMVIVGVLAAIAVPNYYNFIQQGAESAAKNNLIIIQEKQQYYYFAKSGFCIENCGSLQNINSHLSLNIDDNYFSYTCSSSGGSGYCCTATSTSFNPQVSYSQCGGTSGQGSVTCSPGYAGAGCTSLCSGSEVWNGTSCVAEGTDTGTGTGTGTTTGTGTETGTGTATDTGTGSINNCSSIDTVPTPCGTATVGAAGTASGSSASFDCTTLSGCTGALNAMCLDGSWESVTGSCACANGYTSNGTSCQPNACSSADKLLTPCGLATVGAAGTASGSSANFDCTTLSNCTGTLSAMCSLGSWEVTSNCSCAPGYDSADGSCTAEDCWNMDTVSTPCGTAILNELSPGKPGLTPNGSSQSFNCAALSGCTGTLSATCSLGSWEPPTSTCTCAAGYTSNGTSCVPNACSSADSVATLCGTATFGAGTASGNSANFDCTTLPNCTGIGSSTCVLGTWSAPRGNGSIPWQLCTCASGYTSIGGSCQPNV